MASRLSFRRTKIVATLGPASASLETISKLLAEGADAFRLNFSHGDYSTHSKLISNIRRASARLSKPVTIIQDIQGPRFRIGSLPEGTFQLKGGATVRVSSGEGVAGALPVLPAIAFTGMKAGQNIIIGDEGMVLTIRSVRRNLLTCRVVRGGVVRTKQGANFPHAGSVLPPLTEKDIRDIKFGVSKGVDYVALSFVRSARDIAQLRRRLRGTEIGVIAKIETQQAMREIDEIIEACDAILVARGDLAREMSISQVPVLQKFLIERCNHGAKPVITATQMLESMITSPQPTRAEASDVANAVLDGSDALMLSGETASGKYPVDAVAMMAAIIAETEKAHEFEWIRQRPGLEPEHQIDEMIAYLAVGAARTLGAAAIITFTVSGRTALRVGKFRPALPIFAVTPSRATAMKLGIAYGTLCGRVREVGDTDSMISAAIGAAAAEKSGIVKKGDTVVVTAGVPPYIRGKTNLLKLEVV
jgi:pyruvate kinase